MKQFVMFILVCFILGLIAEWVRSSDTEVAKKLKVAKVDWLCVVLIIVYLTYVSAHRDKAFADTGSYWVMFEQYDDKTFADCWSILNWDENNAYYVIARLIKLYISQEFEVYFGITAFLLILGSMIFLYKYSKSMDLAMFLFICGGSFMATMNGIKQFFAVVLIALSVWAIEKRAWYFYFPFVFFIVMQFHRSSMIFLVIFIILNIDIKKRPEIKKNMPYIILALGLLLLISTPVTKGFLAGLAEDTNYGQYSENINSGDTGSNPIRIVFSIIPLALGLVFRDYIEPHEKYYHIFICMTAFSTVFYMLGIIFVFYARFALYFNLFTIPLMTWVVYYAPKEKKKLLYAIIVLFYAVYFYFEMVVSLDWSWDVEAFDIITLRKLLSK